MINLNVLTTMIRIQKPKPSENEFDFPSDNPDDDWEDIYDEDIPCEWKNKHGSESWKIDSTQAKEPATLKLWYIEGIKPSYRIVRVEDGAKFEIVNVDNVMNRNQQLELEVKRYVSG